MKNYWSIRVRSKYELLNGNIAGRYLKYGGTSTTYLNQSSTFLRFQGPGTSVFCAVSRVTDNRCLACQTVSVY